MSIINEWNHMTDENKIDTIRRCVTDAANQEIGGNRLAAFFNRHEPDELLADTWLKLDKRLTADYLEDLNEIREGHGNGQITLISLVWRAARDVIRIAQRADSKYILDCDFSTQDNDGNDIDIMECLITSQKHNTEAEAIARVVISDFIDSLNPTDQIMVNALAQGYKQYEAAQAAEISEGYASKRLSKLRAKYYSSIA